MEHGLICCCPNSGCALYVIMGELCFHQDSAPDTHDGYIFRYCFLLVFNGPLGG